MITARLLRTLTKMDKQKTKTYIPECIYEDIVISGIGGRYPESDSVDEFADNLYNKVDMLTLDNRRWRQGKFKYNQVHFI